ncbi:hypothetical protein KFE25_012052 [Diacronema lutheri]|uniref:RNA helicase n=1 Tax=Diacronema lutheri TaxID=2081491 RepID=A0A8J6C521_DIALT|nr:hypothetical protein KFE25_012052 [Diacronema lutheri]
MAHARRRHWPATQCCDALVLAPTRELAAQIEQHVAAFGVRIDLRSVCCYGGTDAQRDVERIADGVEILVATPGRLLLLLHRHAWLLRRTTLVVLDEADRMLDMGFEPQIREAFAHLPAKRQTLLFTATWPRHVRALAAEFLRAAPVLVRIGQADDDGDDGGDDGGGGGAGGTDGALHAVTSVVQTVEVVARDSDKAERLRAVLRAHGIRERAANGSGSGAASARVAEARAIVFVNTKVRCRELSDALRAASLPADAIHGDRPQAEREAALGAFARGDVRVLVATDVAARGIDVPGVGLVVNYDFPIAVGAQGIEDYVHRIGRSGRAGSPGAAHTLFSAAADGKLAHSLIRVLECAGQAVPAELRAVDQGEDAISARQKRKLPYARGGRDGARGGRGARGRASALGGGERGRGRAMGIGGSSA